jgi:glycosyltransferase involved in cell wall biosynthesis
MAHKTQKFRVVRLIRGVGPSSSPWNNFYANERKIAKGMSYPPIVVGINLQKARWDKDWCTDQHRYYLKTGLFAAGIYLIKLANSTKSDSRTLVVHIHAPVLVILALLLKIFKYDNVKVVTTQHNDWRFFRVHQKLGLRILAEISDRYIACGQAVVKTIPSTISQSLEKKGCLYCIPNGINPKQLKAYNNESFSSDQKKGEQKNECDVVAVVIARMIPQKNCQFILNLLNATPSIDYLIWFGDGPERLNLEQEIKRLGLEKRIELRGCRPRHEVFRALAEATFYISASKWEGLSVADLEAVALGCWPIMSDILQRQEIAGPLEISTYSLSSLEPWVKAIEDFLALPKSTQQEMRRKIQDKALEHFDLNVTIKRYIQLYQSVAKN